MSERLVLAGERLRQASLLYYLQTATNRWCCRFVLSFGIYLARTPGLSLFIGYTLMGSRGRAFSDGPY